jgi:aminodeoxychorismate lyase
MLVFLNGRFVRETEAGISVFDRGFLYGDGLFEAVRVANGRMFRWTEHFVRLEKGAWHLKLRLPLSNEQLRRRAEELICRNAAMDAVLRVTISRGIGQRGYSPQGATRPTVVMSLTPAQPIRGKRPPQWKVITSSVRLPAGEPLAMYKTCNKLPQILARAEADLCEADEALLLNTDGFVVEGSSSNLFWVQRGVVHTPPLASGILQGVTRSVVLDICRLMRLPTRETNVKVAQLRRAAGVFLSLSSWGVVGARSLDGHKLPDCPIIGSILAAYEELVWKETAGRQKR